MTRNEISDLIYNLLDYAYCDNCRFSIEVPYEEKFDFEGGCHHPCYDCLRKEQNWSISRAEADRIAEKICG